MVQEKKKKGSSERDVKKNKKKKIQYKNVEPLFLFWHVWCRSCVGNGSLVTFPATLHRYFKPTDGF